MKILKILGAVGKGFIKDVIPGIGMAEEVISTINNFLPSDKKLDVNATGEDAMNAISELPPVQQAAVLAKRCDVEIAEVQGWTNVITALSDADKAGASTRPKIALMMAWSVVIESHVLVLAIAYGAVFNKPEVIKAITAIWPALVFLLGVPVELLRYYFGKRTEEKQTRANAALGQPVKMPAVGILSKVMKKIF